MFKLVVWRSIVEQRARAVGDGVGARRQAFFAGLVEHERGQKGEGAARTLAAAHEDADGRCVRIGVDGHDLGIAEPAGKGGNQGAQRLRPRDDADLAARLQDGCGRAQPGLDRVFGHDMCCTPQCVGRGPVAGGHAGDDGAFAVDVSAGDGSRSYTATAHDEDGGSPHSSAVSVNVDTTPPAVSITSPPNTTPPTTLAGTITISAGASDDVGVMGVEFRIDGASAVEDTTAPYAVSWNTNGFSNGSHTLTAIARDAAGNQRTSAAVTVTVSNSTLPPPGGIAAQYPGDVGIENHADVIFVERFEQATKTDLFNRWSDVRNGSSMSFAADVPPGSPGGRSLNIPWSSGNDGGHLYRQISPGVDDTLYVRFYIKYPTTDGFNHTGIWVGGSNPPLAWPNPRAGTKPAGNDRFIASAEQNTQAGRFDHYNYWMNMRMSADGKYWGNLLLNDPAVQANRGGWTCVEHMVKLNNPTTAVNGEHAIWLDGVKVSHLGQGFPRGYWSGGIFTQDPNGTPFDGFRWRSDANLKLNWIWLQNYAPADPAGFNGSMKFDHVVVAKKYIGCLASAAPSGDTVAPTVSLTALTIATLLSVFKPWGRIRRATPGMGRSAHGPVADRAARGARRPGAAVAGRAGGAAAGEAPRVPAR